MSRQSPLKADSTVGIGCRVKCLFSASAARAMSVQSPPPSSSPQPFFHRQLVVGCRIRSPP